MAEDSKNLIPINALPIYPQVIDEKKENYEVIKITPLEKRIHHLRLALIKKYSPAWYDGFTKFRFRIKELDEQHGAILRGGFISTLGVLGFMRKGTYIRRALNSGILVTFGLLICFPQYAKDIWTSVRKE